MSKVKIQSYKDLVAWQKAMELVAELYKINKKFPQEELFGLTTQMRKAAVSIPSNIAEGHDRASSGEFKQFLGHARESLAEVETQVLIAQSLSYISTAEFPRLNERIREVGRIINGLISALKNNISQSTSKSKKV